MKPGTKVKYRNWRNEWLSGEVWSEEQVYIWHQTYQIPIKIARTPNEVWVKIGNHFFTIDKNQLKVPRNLSEWF
jgi:hypothetical protein